MLSRDFGLSNISDLTNSLASKFSSKVNALKSTASSIKDVNSLTDVKSIINSATKKSDTTTMNNETAAIMSQICDSSNANKYSDDYLKNLERSLYGKNNIGLCSNAKTSEIDRILMMSTMANSSRKTEYKNLINKSIGGELSNLGYTGSVPSCLYGKVENLIDSLLSGLNGNFKLKLDLLDFLKNNCLVDSLGALENSGLSSKIGGFMTDSFLQAGKKDDAVSLLGNKFSTNPDGTLNILGNSISSLGNSNNASTKLMMYSAMDNNYTGLNTTNLIQSNIIQNVNNDPTTNKNSRGIMESLGSVISSDNSYLFKGMSNINNSAASYLANTKSTDSLASTTKSSNLSLSSLVGISNLFG